MNFPKELKYTKDHEWIRLEGSTATVGITDFAQKELGEIIHVEIDTVGKKLRAGDVFGTIETVKAANDLFIPVSGTVDEVNPDLDSSAEIVNNDPYGKGWLIKISVDNAEDVASLLDAGAYAGIVE